ncbi:MAG: family 10 glycosylhydrolase [Bacteroidota bacterium]
MNKRTFLKTATIGGLSLAASGGLWSCKNGESAERAITKKPVIGQKLPDNWIWLRPDVKLSVDDWKRTFDRIKASGIDAVLAQVYSSNETLFDHPMLPVKDRWLERMLPLAHAAGLQLHAWMWTMPLNNPDLIAKHLDWFSVNRNGQPAHTYPAYVDYYKFLCPCNPEVAEFVAGNVEALGKIEDLDGIHLDYVRQPDVILASALQPKYDIVQDKEYPEYDYPYSENCRNQFKEKHGLDPMDLGDEAPQHAAWRQFRYDAVSNIVNNHCVPTAKKYGKPITAAVFPNWESVRQQWHRWELDAFLPMLYQGFYEADIPWIGEEVKKAKVRLKNEGKDTPVYSGLFLPHLEKAEDLKAAIAVSKANGASGVSLFAYGNFKEAYEGVFNEQ